MNVLEARNIARQWVLKYASQEDGFVGAYFSGSTITLSEQDDLPEASDVDIMIITQNEEPGLKLGKFIYLDTLLEVTHIPFSHIKSVEEVLENYHLAGAFKINTIITDPTGYLTQLQHDVAQHFSKKKWVRKRYENALQKVENGLESLDPLGPLHSQVMSWLFPNGVITHAFLVAALKNPTVRLRYLATRDVLTQYGNDHVYSEIIDLLGCGHLSAERTLKHVHALSQTFDATVAVSKTPFFFSSDISLHARPIVIEGSLKLIHEGNHLEAIFWIIATFCRCHMILSVDGSQKLQKSLLPSFDAILSDIGLYTTDDLMIRAKATREYLPKARKIAEDILLSNPEVRD